MLTISRLRDDLSRFLAGTTVPSDLFDPPNYDWMRPGAEAGKLALVGLRPGEVVDDCLWYEVGEIERLTAEELGGIVDECFAGRTAGFGDVELHLSSVIPEATVLRLRGLLVVRGSLTIRGRYCPLAGVGGYNDLRPLQRSRILNFHEFWNGGERHPPGLDGRS